MVVLWLLGLCLGVGVGEAILVGGASGNTSAVSTSADQLSQDSSRRSTVYGYYPDDFHGSVEHNYGHDYSQGYGHDYGQGYGHGYSHGHDDHGYHHHPYPQPPHHAAGAGLQALLLPLAGVALLGAAAALVSNPVLLQLGVVSGRRRRRDLAEDGQWVEDMALLDKFIKKLPREEVARQERKLLGNYLQCGDGTDCAERLACELHSGQNTEQRLMDRVISEIINNEFVNDKIKKNIVRARKIGHFRGDCRVFPCTKLDKA